MARRAASTCWRSGEISGSVRHGWPSVRQYASQSRSTGAVAVAVAGMPAVAGMAVVVVVGLPGLPRFSATGALLMIAGRGLTSIRQGTRDRQSVHVASCRWQGRPYVGDLLAPPLWQEKAPVERKRRGTSDISARRILMQID